MVNCQWLMEETCHGRFLERKRSRWLLTHHQPCGWSPALEKGGYTGAQERKPNVPCIRPLQGRGTVALAQWWWVSRGRGVFVQKNPHLRVLAIGR